jgi:hypothetical protein
VESLAEESAIMRTMCVVIAAALAWATPVSAKQIPGLPSSAPDELAGDLRGLLLKHLPNPLYETSRDWGRQADARRLQIRGRMRGIDADVVHEPKNDGLWQKLRVDALNPKESLVLDLRNVATKEPGKITFQVFVALDTHFEYQRQRWLSGVKLFDAKARARARVKVTLDCEATARIENGLILPELVVQLKVTKADLRYDNLKFEHIAGIGGEAAQTIGELAHGAVTQWRPSVERDLLEKANAAIVKAGENKEVRLSLAKLFKASKQDGK